MIETKAVGDREFLRAIVETKSFTNGTPQAIALTADGKRVVFLRGEARSAALKLFVFDIASGQERELASAESVLGVADEKLSAEEKARRERMRITARGIVSYELSRDGKRVLFTLSGRAFVLELPADHGAPTGALREIAPAGGEAAPIFDPHLSPDGAQVAFVRNGELWVERFQIGNAGSTARQLTSGASATLLHGQAEFVAQEELSRFRGFWWAPDSQSLVYEEVDESGVEKLFLQDPAHEFRPPSPQAYPRPGKANARTRFGIVPAAGGETRWLVLEEKWEYVARVDWSGARTLLVTALSRDQRDLGLLAFDPAQAGELRARVLAHEHDDAFVNAARDLVWLPEGQGFLWSSDGAGELQLFHRAASGEVLRAVTAPGFRFSSLLGFERKAGVLFALRHETPHQGELWELPVGATGPISLDAPAGARRLAPAPAADESVTAIFARHSRAHVRVSAPAQGPTRFEVFDAEGKPAGALRSVAEAPPLEVNLERAQVGNAPLVAGGGRARDGGFHSLLVRPRDFDKTRRYPLIVQLYGGPHVNTIRVNAASYATDQWIADHGFLVLRADNRGTPLRGRDWERAIAGKFAEVPLDDQVAALQAWAAREPAIDLGRVGVMGHSFGGFLASLAVLKRPDVFRAAVAGAPVVDWMNYDTAYTERYLGVPPPEGNDAYSSNGLLRTAAIDGMTPRPLLISHGTADDNVHFSESLLLCDALFRAGKPFELIPQLGQTHQFHQPDLMLRYWDRVFAFFRAQL